MNTTTMALTTAGKSTSIDETMNDTKNGISSKSHYTSLTSLATSQTCGLSSDSSGSTTSRTTNHPSAVLVQVVSSQSSSCASQPSTIRNWDTKYDTEDNCNYDSSCEEEEEEEEEGIPRESNAQNEAELKKETREHAPKEKAAPTNWTCGVSEMMLANDHQVSKAKDHQAVPIEHIAANVMETNNGGMFSCKGRQDNDYMDNFQHDDDDDDDESSAEWFLNTFHASDSIGGKNNHNQHKSVPKRTLKMIASHSLSSSPNVVMEETNKVDDAIDHEAMAAALDPLAFELDSLSSKEMEVEEEVVFHQEEEKEEQQQQQLVATTAQEHSFDSLPHTTKGLVSDDETREESDDEEMFVQVSNAIASLCVTPRAQQLQLLEETSKSRTDASTTTSSLSSFNPNIEVKLRSSSNHKDADEIIVVDAVAKALRRSKKMSKEKSNGSNNQSYLGRISSDAMDVLMSLAIMECGKDTSSIQQGDRNDNPGLLSIARNKAMEASKRIHSTTIPAGRNEIDSTSESSKDQQSAGSTEMEAMDILATLNESDDNIDCQGTSEASKDHQCTASTEMEAMDILATLNESDDNIHSTNISAGQNETDSQGTSECSKDQHCTMSTEIEAMDILATLKETDHNITCEYNGSDFDHGTDPSPQGYGDGIVVDDSSDCSKNQVEALNVANIETKNQFVSIEHQQLEEEEEEEAPISNGTALTQDKNTRHKNENHRVVRDDKEEKDKRQDAHDLVVINGEVCDESSNRDLSLGAELQQETSLTLENLELTVDKDDIFPMDDFCDSAFQDDDPIRVKPCEVIKTKHNDIFPMEGFCDSAFQDDDPIRVKPCEVIKTKPKPPKFSSITMPPLGKQKNNNNTAFHHFSTTTTTMESSSFDLVVASLSSSDDCRIPTPPQLKKPLLASDRNSEKPTECVELSSTKSFNLPLHPPPLENIISLPVKTLPHTVPEPLSHVSSPILPLNKSQKKKKKKKRRRKKTKERLTIEDNSSENSDSDRSCLVERRQGKLFSHLTINRMIRNGKKTSNRQKSPEKKHLQFDIGARTEDSLRMGRKLSIKFESFHNQEEDRENHSPNPACREPRTEERVVTTPKGILRVKRDGEESKIPSNTNRRVHWDEKQLANKVEKGVMVLGVSSRKCRPIRVLEKHMKEITAVQNGYEREIEKLLGFKNSSQGYIC